VTVTGSGRPFARPAAGGRRRAAGGGCTRIGRIPRNCEQE